MSVEYIVLHTAGAATMKNGKLVAVDQTAATIDRYHREEKGWSGIGYTSWIRFNGKIEAGRPIDEPGAQVEGFNSRSRGICCAGHGDIKAWTPQQWASAVKETIRLLRYFNLVDKFKKNPMRVFGHREINVLIDAGITDAPKTYKTCPGKLVDMKLFRKAVLEALG